MKVAQLNLTFFEKSQTFIYQYVSRLKRFHPIYLADRFINLDQFSVPEEDCYTFYPKKYSWPWLNHGVKRKIFGKWVTPVDGVIRQRGVQLIHAHFGPSGVRAIDTKINMKIPLITTFYGYDVSQLARLPQWKREYPKLFEYGDLFLVEGDHMKSKLAEIGCPAEKIRIQRIAIDLDKIAFKIRQPKQNNEKIQLVFSGRFIEKKGLMYALEAIKKVRERFDNFEFKIIGDGPLRDSIERFIDNHSMDAYVKLLGFLNYEAYIKEFNEADIFIHPSVTASDGDSEGGAPTSILEAQAAGTPVISTFHADIPNIVVPEKSALLSKERDVDGLADNIFFLIKNQDKWAEMGKIGRQFVEDYHDIKREVLDLEKKYQSLVKE